MTGFGKGTIFAANGGPKNIRTNYKHLYERHHPRHNTCRSHSAQDGCGPAFTQPPNDTGQGNIPTGHDRHLRGKERQPGGHGLHIQAGRELSRSRKRAQDGGHILGRAAEDGLLQSCGEFRELRQRHCRIFRCGHRSQTDQAARAQRSLYPDAGREQTGNAGYRGTIRIVLCPGPMA